MSRTLADPKFRWDAVRFEAYQRGIRLNVWWDALAHHWTWRCSRGTWAETGFEDARPAAQRRAELAATEHGDRTDTRERLPAEPAEPNWREAAGA